MVSEHIITAEYKIRPRLKVNDREAIWASRKKGMNKYGLGQEDLETAQNFPQGRR